MYAVSWLIRPILFLLVLISALFWVVRLVNTSPFREIVFVLLALWVYSAVRRAQRRRASRQARGF